MASSRPSRRTIGQSRRPPPLKSFWEANAKKLVLAAATVAGVVTIANYTSPVLNSHLPAASQDDVKGVETKATTAAQGIVKQLEQLDARQTQSVERGAQVADQLRSFRMRELRDEIKRLQGAKDPASIRLLSDDEQELDELSRMK